MLQIRLCCKLWESKSEQMDALAVQGAPSHRLQELELGQEHSGVAAGCSISCWFHQQWDSLRGREAFVEQGVELWAGCLPQTRQKVQEWASAQLFPARNGVNALVFSLLCPELPVLGGRVCARHPRGFTRGQKQPPSWLGWRLARAAKGIQRPTGFPHLLQSMAFSPEEWS